MINFTVGAMRPAIDDARIAAANDLVQRTLARHGLMPHPESGHDGPTQPGIDAVLPRFKTPFGRGSSNSPMLPAGAEFQQDRYYCAAGSRAYRTYIPSTAAEGVSGIVVMLHGCTQNPEDFAIGTGMNTLAEEHGFVVIYPEQSRGENAQSCWNWFSPGDQCRDRGEPAILAGMTCKVMADHGVSKDRTFVAGLSAGAAMAVILGETYRDVFAAVGAHSGLAYGAASDVPSAFAAMAGMASDAALPVLDMSAIPTIIFHGTADATVHPSNGDRIARDVMDRGARQTLEKEHHGHAGGRRFVCRTTATSDGSTLLEDWRIEGLGHAWSGGQPGGSHTDGQGPDASAEIVRFFFAATEKAD